MLEARWLAGFANSNVSVGTDGRVRSRQVGGQRLIATIQLLNCSTIRTFKCRTIRKEEQLIIVIVDNKTDRLLDWSYCRQLEWANVQTEWYRMRYHTEPFYKSVPVFAIPEAVSPVNLVAQILSCEIKSITASTNRLPPDEFICAVS